jgi:hypothetical protein
MANFVYTKAKEALLNGQINVTSFNYKVILINKSNYTVNQSTDEFVSNIPSLAIRSVSGNLSNVMNNGGVLSADDITIDHDGSSFDAIVCYQVGTNDANSRLFFYIDVSPGLPYGGSNSGGPVTIFWSDSISKILSL